MFDLDRFIADCIAAAAETSRQPVREIVARAVAEPAALIAAGAGRACCLARRERQESSQVVGLDLLPVELDTFGPL